MSICGQIGNARTGWIVKDGTVDLTRRRGPVRRVHADARPGRVVFDLGRTALIVVDMQNDFCAPGGWLSHIGVDVSPLAAPVGAINDLAADLRTLGVPVIFLNWGNRPDRANLPTSILHVYDPDGSGTGIGDRLPNGSAVLERGSWSSALVDGLESIDGDIFVDKYRMTGFVDTELDSILRNLDISTVLFAGVNLDQCVYATLSDAAALGYDCILVEDCCATTSPAACITATHYNVAQCFGFISSSVAILDGLREREERQQPFERHVPDRLAHRISAGDSVKMVLLRGPDDSYDASVFLEIWDPGGSQPPNSHPDSVESFYFLSGEGVAHSDGEQADVRAKELIVLPSGSLHRIENSGPGRLYAITTMTPDAGFAALVESGPSEPLDAEDLLWMQQARMSQR